MSLEVHTYLSHMALKFVAILDFYIPPTSHLSYCPLLSLICIRKKRKIY